LHKLHLQKIVIIRVRLEQLIGPNTWNIQVLNNTTGQVVGSSGNVSFSENEEKNIDFQVTIPASDLVAGHVYSVGRITSNTRPAKFFSLSSYWKISQNPLPTPPLPVSGSSGNLFFTSSINPNSIFTTSSQFIQYYGNSNVKQRDIPGSGFFPIKYPIEFFKGDEFRFEGLEDKVFTVKEVTKSTSSFSSTSLNIELNSPISGSGIDVNQFLVRRYVEDGSSLILRSQQGANGEGPLYVIPEFITDKLNTDLDTITNRLRNEGFIE